MAMPRPRDLAKPVSNVVDPVWAGTDWTLSRALRTARFWWIALGYFCGLYIWYAVQVHQTKFLLDIGFSPSVGVWALGNRQPAWHSRPDLARPSLRPDRTLNGCGRSAAWLCDLLCGADRSEILARAAAGLSDGLTQGALGYGLTSIMGAVVLEIFQGKQYGSIFGTIMLARWPAAPRVPGLPASVRLSRQLHRRLCDRHCVSVLSALRSGRHRRARCAPSRANCTRRSGLAASTRLQAVSLVKPLQFHRALQIADGRRNCRPAWSPDRSGGAGESRPPSPE
jgi:hypothetical protein